MIMNDCITLSVYNQKGENKRRERKGGTEKKRNIKANRMRGKEVRDRPL